jgi:signal transduction histidine kinase
LRGWEQEFLKKSGEVFIAELSAQILVVRGEKLILSTVVDITERERAEHALVRAEKLAAAGRMAATVAHEINNPLAAVMNSIYIALLDTALDETTRQHLRTAEQELVRVANLTRQTLAFYRDHSAAESTSVDDLLDGVLRTYEHKLRNKHVQVTKEIAVQTSVTTMVGELRQALSNIVANSIDALPDGGRLSIRARGTSVDGVLQRRLVITVADNGAGIAPELRERIFDPFFTTKGDIGTGLGLWVTRELLRKNGGSIRMRSRPGLGTAFTIFMPVPLITAAVAD